MGLFSNKQAEIPPLPQFRDRGEAFSYMLSSRIAQGVEPLQAAKDADEFANIYALNAGLPEKQVPPPEGIDKYIDGFNKCCRCIEEHPRLVELAIPVLSFIAGIFVKKETTQSCVPAAEPPIDATNLE